MVRVKYGIAVSELIGTIGGVTFQGGQHSKIARTKPISSRSKTEFTGFTRGRFATSSQHWRSLSQADRDSWNAVAANWPAIDKFGDPITLSGYEVFMRCSQNLQLVGESIVDTGSNPVSLWDPGTVTLTAAVTGSNLAIAWTGGAISAANTIEVYLAAEAPPSRAFRRNRIKGVTTFPATTTSPQGLDSEYTDRYGTFPSEGSRIYCAIRVVSTSNGTASQLYTASAIVAS